MEKNNKQLEKLETDISDIERKATVNEAEYNKRMNKLLEEYNKTKENQQLVRQNTDTNIVKKTLINRTERKKGYGWTKLAGYEDTKTMLDESFINKLALEA